jgi:hypothetical protein
MVPVEPEAMLVVEAVSVALAQVVDNAGAVTVTDGTLWLNNRDAAYAVPADATVATRTIPKTCRNVIFMVTFSARNFHPL